MKKLLILLLVISIAAFSLISCFKSGNNNGSNSGSNGGDSGNSGDVELEDNGPPDENLIDPEGWTKPDKK